MDVEELSLADWAAGRAKRTPPPANTRLRRCTCLADTRLDPLFPEGNKHEVLVPDPDCEAHRGRLQPAT